MTGSRFDAWTRRRLGQAMGGGLTSLLGLNGLDDAEAKKKRRKPCKKLRQGCQPGNKNRKCCRGLTCGEVLGASGTSCCRPLQGFCTDARDCCVDLNCDDIAGLTGTRCCGDVASPCSDDRDCCGVLFCNASRQCAMPR